MNTDSTVEETLQNSSIIMRSRVKWKLNGYNKGVQDRNLRSPLGAKKTPPAVTAAVGNSLSIWVQYSIVSPRKLG